MRKDLSNWLIHFVHNSSEKHLPKGSKEQDIPDLVYNIADEDIDEEQLFAGRLGTNQISVYNDNLDAFNVLKSIIKNGFIKSTWSFRNGKPTIYGLKSTVCFTEMPLYALLDYAKKRNNKDSVSAYGIIFPREELFNAQVRPVIYGITNKHKEENTEYILRCLTDECGIGINEQYRYVALNLNRSPRIDWMHEREWRWGGLEDYGVPADVPGFPLFEFDENYLFSSVIFLVKTNIEAEEIIELLRITYDAGYNDFYEVNIDTVRKCLVISLESIEDKIIENQMLTIDDIPTYRMKGVEFSSPIVSDEAIINKALKEAQLIYTSRNKELIKSYQQNQYSVCGFGYVATNMTNTTLTRFLIQKEVLHSDSDGNYIIYGLGDSHTQDAEINYLSAVDAAKYLTDKLGQEFYAIKRLD